MREGWGSLLPSLPHFWYDQLIVFYSEVNILAGISKEDVLHVAHLARLTLNDEEAERLTTDLGNIIQFAEQLNELDTENIPETTHVLDMKNVLREDVSRDWLTREEALKNAPDQENGQVKVPKVFED